MKKINKLLNSLKYIHYKLKIIQIKLLSPNYIKLYLSYCVKKQRILRVGIIFSN